MMMMTMMTINNRVKRPGPAMSDPVTYLPLKEAKPWKITHGNNFGKILPKYWRWMTSVLRCLVRVSFFSKGLFRISKGVSCKTILSQEGCLVFSHCLAFVSYCFALSCVVSHCLARHQKLFLVLMSQQRRTLLWSWCHLDDNNSTTTSVER